MEWIASSISSVSVIARSRSRPRIDQDDNLQREGITSRQIIVRGLCWIVTFSARYPLIFSPPPFIAVILFQNPFLPLPSLAEIARAKSDDHFEEEEDSVDCNGWLWICLVLTLMVCWWYMRWT